MFKIDKLYYFTKSKSCSICRMMCFVTIYLCEHNIKSLLVNIPKTFDLMTGWRHVEKGRKYLNYGNIVNWLVVQSIDLYLQTDFISDDLAIRHYVGWLVAQSLGKRKLFMPQSTSTVFKKPNWNWMQMTPRICF